MPQTLDSIHANLIAVAEGLSHLLFIIDLTGFFHLLKILEGLTVMTTVHHTVCITGITWKRGSTSGTQHSSKFI